MPLVKTEENWWGQQKDVGQKKKKRKKKEINTVSHASCNQIKKLTQFLWWEGALGKGIWVSHASSSGIK